MSGRWLSVKLLGALSAVTYGGLYVLSEYFEPVPEEVTYTLPGVKIRRQ